MDALAQAQARAPAVGLRGKLSFGFGDLGLSLAWNAAAAFLLFFYTDVALLPAGTIGLIFLLSRLLDAGFDFAVGILVDRTRSRWGRARPYFLFGAIPYGLLCLAIFWMPQWGPSGKLLWAATSFLLFGVMFSIVAIPYNALLPMMTEDPRERLQMGSFRSASTSLSVIIATALTMPMVGWFGAGDRAFGFACTAGVFGAIAAALLFNLFVNCRERVRAPSQRAKVAVWPAVGQMLRNRAWVVVFLFTALNFIRFGAVLSVVPYFAVNVLHRPALISVLLPSVSGTLLVGSMIALPYLRRLGMRAGNMLALAGAIAVYAVLPFCEGSAVLFVATYVFASLLLSLTMTAIFAMAAETVDYHQLLYGVRNEGLLSAGISLSTKLGIALGGAVTAFGLAAAAYDAQAVSTAAVHMMRFLFYGPACLTIVLQILCIRFYPKAILTRNSIPVTP
jgi:GPH family glycoside/pentoside/hexuronide:cation symporter